jgi:A/G-specific adenine glycosylase
LSIENTPHHAILTTALLDWITAGRRDLPWRQTRTPYAVWISEIMLQQTQAVTVAPYFERWMARFPSVQELAEAPLDDVLKAWEGLGYYARARHLHKAAQLVTHDLGGQMPATAEALLLLPGVGRYTAAAIASIAFRQDSIALDGNLDRVLCRLYGIDDDPGRLNTQHRLEKLAQAMLSPGHAGDFNQALMDLGATICTPTKPRCLLCPLMSACQAHQEGIQNDLPIRATRSQRPHRDVTAGIIWDRTGHFLITQRPLDGLLGGMWEFPGGKRRPGEALAACLHREISEELSIEIQVGELLCTVEHAFTHFQMTLYAFECSWLGGMPQCLGCSDLRWVTLDELAGYPFPVADQKIISFLREQRTEHSP